MEDMLVVCEQFAQSHNLEFSTDPNPSKSKTKCIFICGQARALKKPANLKLFGRELPWVQSAVHLGHELHESGTMKQDAIVKMALFITRSTEVRETFSFAAPVEVLSAVKVYTCDFYGAMLWDLFDENTEKLYRSWNTCIKLVWNVPRATHTYFLEHMLGTGFSHIRTDIIGRFCNYFKRMLESTSGEVRILANIVGRDVRSTTGKNLWNIKNETGLDVWECSTHEVKKYLNEVKSDVPLRDQWRPAFLAKLLIERGEKSYQGEDVDELTELIDSLCVG